jgi:hypothetical protein
MRVYFGGFYVVVPELFLDGADIIYMDVVYADFAGAKICLHRNRVNGLQRSDVMYGS